MDKYIQAEASKTTLNFDPGNSTPETVVVTVHNNSYQNKSVSRFASFRLELLAAGEALPNAQAWYRLSPAVSCQIPPGDSTQFEIEILEVPPIAADFIGTLILTARVYSPELKDEVRKDIRLVVKGDRLQRPTLAVNPVFKAAPDDDVEIKLAIHNPNPQAIACAVRLNGLSPDWLLTGQQKAVSLKPNDSGSLSFRCRVPPLAQANSRTYPLSFDLVRPIDVQQAAQSSLIVSPAGIIHFNCDPAELWLPKQPGRWLNPRQSKGTVALQFDNQSNLEVESGVTVLPPKRGRFFRRFKLFRRFKRFRRNPNATSRRGLLTVEPTQVPILPGEKSRVVLAVHQRSPWLGWPRSRQLRLKPWISESGVTLENESPTVPVHVAPIVTPWLQLLTLALGGLALGLLGWQQLNFGHDGSVTAVQINGQGNEVISASQDGTLRRWQIKGQRLASAGVIATGDKTIRTARYRPVRNDEIAAGFENNVTQMVSQLSSSVRPMVFSAESGDRVLALDFSRDARTLFIAYGSGAIYRWAADPSERQLVGYERGAIDGWAADPSQRQQVAAERLSRIKVDFAPYAIALVGDTDNLLAVGGAYNQFVLVDIAAESITRLTYEPNGGTNDLILDMATSEQRPNRLATADNRGRISLWDMSKCPSVQNCKPIARWNGHGDEAVKSVAFSQDGCYLVSGGDDGRVMLWPLTAAGQPSLVAGDRLRKSAQNINAVDITQYRDRLRIASGGDDQKVKISTYRLRNRSSGCLLGR